MDILSNVAATDADHVSDVIQIAIQRYRELFPDWEICFFSFKKTVSRNELIDMQISFLQQLKECDVNNQ